MNTSNQCCESITLNLDPDPEFSTSLDSDYVIILKENFLKILEKSNYSIFFKNTVSFFKYKEMTAFEEIFSQLSLGMVNLFLQSYTFVL